MQVAKKAVLGMLDLLERKAKDPKQKAEIGRLKEAVKRVK